MDNPYQSPTSSPAYVRAPPQWYLFFNQLYWSTWWIGTAMIAGSWLNIVSPMVGWIGFGIACAASLFSYVMPSLVGIKAQDHVVLDSLQLKTQGDEYHDAMKRFESGASLTYDGVTFGLRSNNELACYIIADSLEFDESKATEIAHHAQAVFNYLISECTDFSSAVAGRTFRISILSGRAAGFRNLCDVVEGKIEWKR